MYVVLNLKLQAVSACCLNDVMDTFKRRFSTEVATVKLATSHFIKTKSYHLDSYSYCIPHLTVFTINPSIQKPIAV